MSDSPVIVQRPTVRLFDHILMWPVLLHDCEEKGDAHKYRREHPKEELEQYWGQIESNSSWRRVCSDCEKHDDEQRPLDTEYRQLYDEVVYFHPFVRKFLYERPQAGPSLGPAGDADSEFDGGVTLFERNDISGVKVEIWRGDIERLSRLTLGVTKVQMFVFDTIAAMLVLRLSNESPNPAIQSQIKAAQCDTLSLDDVLAFQEVFRRVYPPFWMGDPHAATATPGYQPASVEWLGTDGQELSGRVNDPVARPKPSSNAHQQREIRAFVHQHVQSPVNDHFQYLMYPLFPYEGRPSQARDAANNIRWLAFRQILDERIPVMSFVAVDNIQLLTQADWFRMTFADSPGAHPSVFPYAINSPDIVQFGSSRAFPKSYQYDRYWGPKYHPDDTTVWNNKSTDKDGHPKELQSWQAEYTTRYLCCGYAFAVVGQYSSFDHDMFTVYIRKHMQHHYFKLGMIAQFGRAALLAFDDRLAFAVQHRLKDESKFRQKVEDIEQDFISFRSRYWFSEVTNHLQGREMFDWWTGHLEVDSLFCQVREKIEDVTDSLNRRATTELNDQLKMLTMLGVGISVGSAAISCLGFLKDVKPFKCGPFPLWTAAFAQFAAGVAIGYVVAKSVPYLLRQQNHKR